ncbi:ribosome-inactivating protein PD-L3/PD-L4-like [Chenopodium quinoa]|uniref:rRNA N-glycosylase n=1 Tax=Chenopodium quinoa TaxID=63459 RepID=A0A803MNT0_CHEQI|nr:ribosome-inactivating protein PD-L3/PD-L4-like [Chenopodium quinoa]XP_021750695.1 ribosome-inactivating protein PD-L3/PD-L4-like [Chenopodium quinoa]XP_021750696.1 ribosome-inactivating protein PD-L3/PD-L4-like [Chenopodium quinoa]
MNGIQTIMRAFVVVAISTWLVILKPTFAASDLSFDATNPAATTYSKLLSDLRNLVKDPKLKYGGTNVPVMAATFKKKYILVDLKGSEGGTITIALNLNNDIYVVGYLDKLNGNFRSHIFKDAPSDAKTDLFPEATGKNRLTINYKSSYADIESNAGVSSRARVGLGVKPLNKFINDVYGKALVVKNEAQFMLVVIQMVSEATRFKYIESMILEKFADSYNPDPKAMRLEIRWSKISKGIKDSKKGVISPELDLKDVNDKDWKVTKVEDIVNDMALLKNFGSSSQVSVFTKLKLFMTKFLITNIGEDQAADL